MSDKAVSGCQMASVRAWNNRQRGRTIRKQSVVECPMLKSQTNSSSSKLHLSVWVGHEPLADAYGVPHGVNVETTLAHAGSRVAGCGDYWEW